MALRDFGARWIATLRLALVVIARRPARYLLCAALFAALLAGAGLAAREHWVLSLAVLWLVFSAQPPLFAYTVGGDQSGVWVRTVDGFAFVLRTVGRWAPAGGIAAFLVIVSAAPIYAPALLGVGQTSILIALVMAVLPLWVAARVVMAPAIRAIDGGSAQAAVRRSAALSNSRVWTMAGFAALSAIGAAIALIAVRRPSGLEEPVETAALIAAAGLLNLVGQVGLAALFHQSRGPRLAKYGLSRAA